MESKEDAREEHKEKDGEENRRNGATLPFFYLTSFLLFLACFSPFAL
jgi:hypothetical protein